MKRPFFICAIVAFLSIATFTSCNDDESYSVGNYTIAWGTVGQNQGGGITVNRDNGTTLFVQSSRVPASAFVPGERVIVNYMILGDDGNRPPKSYNVQVNSLQRILTKGLLLQSFIDVYPVFRGDSIGNDPITVREAWFGGHYLNLHFSAYFGDTRTHLITLVRDDVVTPDDTVRLYLHHNACDDPQRYSASGYVAFDIASIIPAGGSSVPVKLIWSGYDGREHSDKGTFTYPAVVSAGYRSSEETAGALRVR